MALLFFDIALFDRRGWQLTSPVIGAESVRHTLLAGKPPQPTREVFITHGRLAAQSVLAAHEKGWACCLDGFSSYFGRHDAGLRCVKAKPPGERYPAGPFINNGLVNNGLGA